MLRRRSSNRRKLYLKQRGVIFHVRYYVLLYQSETGNTRKLAATIFSRLPGNSKDLIDITTDKTIPEAKIYFIGFCVHQYLQHDRQRFPKQLKRQTNRSVRHLRNGRFPSRILPGDISCSVSAWIESDNQYLGSFLCQGRMPQQVRKKYETLRTPENAEKMDFCIRNFDDALTHPDSLNFEHAKVFVDRILKLIGDGVF